MELSNFIWMPLLKVCVCVYVKLHIILDKVHKSVLFLYILYLA